MLPERGSRWISSTNESAVEDHPNGIETYQRFVGRTVDDCERPLIVVDTAHGSHVNPELLISRVCNHAQAIHPSTLKAPRVKCEHQNRVVLNPVEVAYSPLDARQAPRPIHPEH